MRPLAIFALACVAVVSVGCGDAAEVEAEGADALVGGRDTFAYPAVGVTVLDGATGCSATLVASRVILLAGHCFGPGATRIDPWQFEIRHDATTRFRYGTGDGLVLGRSPGADDVALLRLTSSVPPEVARPIPIASSWPHYGTRLDAVGFGCTDRQTGAGAGTKRLLSTTYRLRWDLGWTSSGNCPGDSGGALIDSGRPAVVGVISGWRNPSGYDLFGDVPKHRATLAAQIDAWR
jgi:hypothetical protein